jgi:hypothetical protein
MGKWPVCISDVAISQTCKSLALLNYMPWAAPAKAMHRMSDIAVIDGQPQRACGCQQMPAEQAIGIRGHYKAGSFKRVNGTSGLGTQNVNSGLALRMPAKCSANTAYVGFKMQLQ